MGRTYTIDELTNKCGYDWIASYTTSRDSVTNNHICCRPRGHQGVHRCDCGCLKGAK